MTSVDQKAEGYGGQLNQRCVTIAVLGGWAIDLHDR